MLTDWRNTALKVLPAMLIAFVVQAPTLAQLPDGAAWNPSPNSGESAGEVPTAGSAPASSSPTANQPTVGPVTGAGVLTYIGRITDPERPEAFLAIVEDGGETILLRAGQLIGAYELVAIQGNYVVLRHTSTGTDERLELKPAGRGESAQATHVEANGSADAPESDTGQALAPTPQDAASDTPAVEQRGDPRTLLPSKAQLRVTPAIPSENRHGDDSLGGIQEADPAADHPSATPDEEPASLGASADDPDALMGVNPQTPGAIPPETAPVGEPLP